MRLEQAILLLQPDTGEVVLLCWTDGGLAKVDFGFDYAANFSSFACVA